MSDIAIKVENLSKRYRIGLEEELPDTLVGALTQAVKRPFRNWRRLRRLTHFGNGSDGGPSQPVDLPTSQPSNASSVRTDVDRDTLWALRDVSFEVKRGEVVGIIGRNGAGKSTLLKILARITHPTSGRVELHGRVGSLLEVGTGFHPELTGRENIYMNGTLLGMTKAEVDRKFDEIVDFSGVEKFIDTPVKRYSSGMRVRLAFSVAAHLEPEILLVDEVLAVGDAGFQRKCLGKMEDVAGQGRTVLFVSHDMAAVENLCHRVALLADGRLVRRGDPGFIIDYYLGELLPSVIDGIPLLERTDRSGNGIIRFTEFHIEDSTGTRLETIRSGMDVVLVFEYCCQVDVNPVKVDVGFSLQEENDRMLCVLYSSYVDEVFDSIPHKGYFRCRVTDFPLAGGRYKVGARVTVNGEESDWPRDGIAYLDVEDGDFYGTGRKGFNGRAPFLISGNWDVENAG